MGCAQSMSASGWSVMFPDSATVARTMATSSTPSGEVPESPKSVRPRRRRVSAAHGRRRPTSVSSRPPRESLGSTSRVSGHAHASGPAPGASVGYSSIVGSVAVDSILSVARSTSSWKSASPGTPSGLPSGNETHSARGGRTRSVCSRTRLIEAVATPARSMK